MRLRFALLAALWVAPYAEATPELARQFAQQADLDVSHDGLVMLVLPPAVMAATRADLADLRITDRSGRELPFFVEASRPLADGRGAMWALVRDVARSMSPGEHSDAGPSVSESYTLAPIEATLATRGLPFSPSERWGLEVVSASDGFVRRIRVETLSAEGLLTTLVESGPLFRIQGAERTRIALPPHGGELVVTIDGRERDYLKPVFRFVPVSAAPAAAPSVVALPTLSLRTEGAETVITVVRPLGLVPGALQLEADDLAFARRVRVIDRRTDGELEIGSGSIVRARDLVAAESLEIALRAPASGSSLSLRIGNLDSPPLQNLRVSALVAQPALVFALADHGDAQPDGTLHFGGGQALRPIYDLASLAELFPNPAQLERALAGIDPAALRLGPLRNNPIFAPTPALAFAMQPGAQLDVRGFAQRRALSVAASANGLSRYRFAPEDVAAAQPDLADVRVIAEGGVQWPFLLAADGAREWREVSLRAATGEPRRSRYSVELPAAGIRATALELETDAPYFDRAYRLVTRDANGADRQLVSGRLVRAPERSVPVRIALPGVALASAELVIEDGDDAPLAFARASLQIVLPEVFVTAPPGSYWLLLGDREATAPAYELERVRESVLAVPSAGIQPGALEANPGFSAARDLASGVRGRTLLVWVVLGSAVLVLAALTLRAARSEGPGSPPAA